MNMFYLAWSIVPPCGYRLLSFIWFCWIALFAVRKGCVRVNFVDGATESKSMPCVYSMKIIIKRITLCMSIYIILLHFVIL